MPNRGGRKPFKISKGRRFDVEEPADGLDGEHTVGESVGEQPRASRN